MKNKNDFKNQWTTIKRDEVHRLVGQFRSGDDSAIPKLKNHGIIAWREEEDAKGSLCKGGEGVEEVYQMRAGTVAVGVDDEL